MRDPATSGAGPRETDELAGNEGRPDATVGALGIANEEAGDVKPTTSSTTEGFLLETRKGGHAMGEKGE